MKKRLVSLLAIVSLLILSVFPAIYAEEDVTESATAAAQTVRIEAEDFATNPSGLSNTTKNTKTSGTGITYLDDMREGNFLCVGRDLDLTGLQTITLAIGHNASGVVYGLYMDGTNNQLGLKIATITGEASGGWETFKALSADIDVAPAMVAGTHTLFLKVEAAIAGNQYCGNLDYVELTFGGTSGIATTRMEGEAVDTSRSNTSASAKNPETGLNVPDGTVASGDAWLDGTGTGDVIYLGEYDLTGLYGLALCIGNNQLSGVTYAFYIDGTASNPGRRIAELTGIASGGWFTFKKYTVSLSNAVPETQLAGTHTLFLSVEGASGYGGNIDYVDLIMAEPYNGVLITEKTYSFPNDLNTAKSSGTYNRGHIKTAEAYRDSENVWHDAEYSNVYSISDSKDGVTLAYDNVDFDSLKTVALTYLLQGATSMDLYKGNPNDGGTLLKTLSLDAASLSGTTNLWYTVDKLRTSYYDLSDIEAAGTDTLYIKLTTSQTYAGNYTDFTLYYETTAVSVDLCQMEAEDYVWAIGTDCYPVTTGDVTHINNCRNGDIFYLGKADISDLSAITVRTASAASGISYALYADMDVDFAHMELKAEGARRYSGNASGGTLLANLAIAQTGSNNNWQIYSTFSQEMENALTGEHEIYLVMSRGEGSDFTGNIDWVRFVGLSQDSFDTASNFPADEVTVRFVGKFAEEVYTTTVSSAKALAELLDTVNAPALGGYTFCGWSERDADALFAANIGGSVTITPVYSVGDNAGERTRYSVTIGADIQPVDSSIDLTNIFFDDRVELKVADSIDGVSYWVLDGQKMAYGATSFTFYVTGNNTVSVVLNDDASTPEASVNIQQYATQYNAFTDTYVLSVIAQSYVPTGTATEYGMYYTSNAAELQNIKNENPSIGQYVQVRSSKTGNNQQYMTHLLNVNPQTYRYAMAYAIIDGKTVYSPVVLQFYTNDGSVTVKKATMV